MFLINGEHLSNYENGCDNLGFLDLRLLSCSVLIFERSKTNYVHVRVSQKDRSRKRDLSFFFLSRIVITASCAGSKKRRQTLYVWTRLSCQRGCLREYCYRMSYRILRHTYVQEKEESVTLRAHCATYNLYFSWSRR